MNDHDDPPSSLSLSSKKKNHNENCEWELFRENTFGVVDVTVIVGNVESSSINSSRVLFFIVISSAAAVVVIITVTIITIVIFMS